MIEFLLTIALLSPSGDTHVVTQKITQKSWTECDKVANIQIKRLVKEGMAVRATGWCTRIQRIK